MAMAVVVHSSPTKVPFWPPSISLEHHPERPLTTRATTAITTVNPHRRAMNHHCLATVVRGRDPPSRCPHGHQTTTFHDLHRHQFALLQPLSPESRLFSQPHCRVSPCGLLSLSSLRSPSSTGRSSAPPRSYHRSPPRPSRILRSPARARRVSNHQPCFHPTVVPCLLLTLAAILPSPFLPFSL
ncbi:hypothetical protein SESBI_05910 [Sesbania bispinosa]|nr:hypothetical protein SESBI_05910 [Sesbania bispinosa]